MNSWKTFETAPNNGSELLIYVEESKEQFVAFWDGVGFRFATKKDGGAIRVKNPTHWMPLPPPPTKD